MNRNTSKRQRERALRSSMRRLIPQGAHRWALPVITLLMLLGIIAGAIWVSSVTRQHVHLDDGTVWVTSLKNRKAARFNVRLKEADAAVASSATRFDVAQHDSDTILTEGQKATGIVSSTLGTAGHTETKGNTTAVANGGSIAFLNTKTGDVWTGLSGELDSVSPANADPSMRLGAGGKVAVTADGTVYGYRPGDGMVFKAKDPRGNSSQVESITGGGAMAADDFTVIGDTPVIVSGGKLYWNGGDADTGTSDRLTLQYPGTDDVQSGWVGASGRSGLYLVPLGKGSQHVNVLASGGTGEPSKPVSSSGCVYAAWAQSANNYVRVCSQNVSGIRFSSLQAVSATSDLVFRTNHRKVVLNDVVSGDIWNPADSTKVIKIQWNKIQTEQTEQQKQNDQSANNQRNFSKTCSAQSGQIKATDDEFGARAGGQQILDVLRNDEQTDCSVLRIAKVGAPAGASVTVAPVYDGRYLQLDASAASAGTVTFTYDISDGRGQTSSANVKITLNGKSANHAPKQIDTPPEYDVEQGGTYTTNALGSFQDQDGDPMTLISAVARNSDQVVVSTRADGQLVFNTGSALSGRIAVEVTVSDGTGTGTGLIYFSIRPANTLPAAIDAVTKQTTPNTDTTVDLKPYVHGTSVEPAQLTAVEPPAKTNATMNSADMSFTFKATASGTYYVPYTITQGSIAATGLARLEVQPAAGESAKPVTANDVALLGSDNTAIVEPLANDVDPMGGVLSVTSVNADPSLGIKTGLVSHKRVYLTARQVPAKPVKITYTAANAAGSTTGTIVLQPPALSAGNSAPKAANVNTTVRTGGIVSVDVLDHVSHPDGTTVTLQNKLQYDKATFKGLVFVSGDTVRYQASNETGTYTVNYTVKDNLGNAASGSINFAVHKKDSSNKAAPTPQDVTAQVAGGQKVRIPITLTGIDPDGDDDQLLGLGNKAPQLGRITEVGANYMVYEAYEDSAGTDTFSYAVEDWTGQRTQAQVRVGVFRGASDSGVYARDDEITLRPHTAATVPVTLNDISGDNTDLAVGNKLESKGIAGAKVADNMITFTTPNQAGTFYIIYTVSDKAGLSDTATLSVNVNPQASIEPPTAYDYRVPSAATIDKKTVEVDVAQWIANPSGTAKELQVGVDPSASDHAKVKGGATSTVISVDLTSEARAVPYTVTNTTYGVTSTAFIQVPAYGVFPPTLRPKAPELKVNSRETITINIADYVRVGAGKTAYVQSANSVSATKSDGGSLYVNDQTLKFTAAKDYGGPASITFTAVDGKGGDKTKIINSSVLTLPITIIGREVPPPTFSTSTIDVVAGEDAKTIDLTALTHAPSGSYEDERQYTYSGGGESGVIISHVTAAGKLTVSAPKDAAVGSMASIHVVITYSGGTVKAGLTARVVQSNRPLARIDAKNVKVKAGSTQRVDLFANAYNPFPDSPLRAINCRADDSSKLTVDCASSGIIAITAGNDIGASSNTVLVTVQDGTGSAERQVTATITVSVVDKPDAPLLSPVAGKPADGAVTLSWTAGSANGSPITEYQVDWNGGSKSCGATTTCQVTGLTNGEEYSFTVKAKNDVGWSKPSTAVKATPDKVPDPPKSVKAEAGYHAVKISWSTPDYVGTKPDGYTVKLVGSNGFNASQDVASNSYMFQLDNPATGDRISYSATVTAKNRAGSGQPSAVSNTVSPWGDPDAPTVTLSASGNTLTASVRLGDLHGAGCSSVELSGAMNKTLSCEALTAESPVSRGQWYESLTVKATVNPAQSESKPASAMSNPVTPNYEVQSPKNITMRRDDDQCVINAEGSGEYDRLFITYSKTSAGGASSEPQTESFTSGQKPHVTYTLDPWTSCGSANARQEFKGHSSKSISAPPDTSVYKTPAHIEQPTLTWSATDRNRIDVEGGSVNTYGQQATVLICFSTDKNAPSKDNYQWNITWDLARQQHYIDISSFGIKTDTLYWYISITSNTAPELSPGDTILPVKGTRKPAQNAGTITEHTAPNTNVKAHIGRMDSISSSLSKRSALSTTSHQGVSR